MPKINPKISVIITAHHEGRLAHPTFNSVFRSVNYAKERGINTEIVVVLDKPDDKTEAYFNRFWKNIPLKFRTDFGDPGLARNYGVEQATGNYVAFLDADNLFCKNWIYDALNYLKSFPDRDMIVAHPNYIVSFDAKDIFWKQIASTDPQFRVTNLLEYNHWDTTSLLKRDTALEYPFMSSTLAAGFYADDWEWGCRLLAAGVEHHVVPKTVYFRREKPLGSVLNAHRAVHSIVLPNKLFQPDVLNSILLNQCK